MYLKHQPSGNLIEVLDIQALVNPCHGRVTGRFHAGEELQEEDQFSKSELVFPSEEHLPNCWLDPEYRMH